MEQNFLLEINTIVSRLRNNGIYISTKPISDDDIEQLMKEFRVILNDTEKHKRGVEIKCAVIDRQYLEINKLNSVYSFFFKDLFTQVSKKYLKGKYHFCHEIYVTLSSPEQKTYANELHFDVQRQLKFFIYLNDVDETNGAFHYIPGSHKWVESYRAKNEDKINYANREVTRPNESEVGEPVPLIGKAGTWFIFDTNLIHKAGNVSSGERLAMRGHVKVLKQDTLFKRIRKFFNEK